ncbi:MAG: hypothetical protein H6955_00075 [Chromatiaceae bacterium]|nr:hypothetical protein [Gammaproteobacteria bacterium]MCP5311915.1 hypothetical protein [Chromatiaceae bacterium]
MTRTRDPDEPMSGADEAPSSKDPATVLSNQARLARDERSAALRALAGRLAHQLRNPLAAVRAACSSLRAEIEDTDQRETLDLTLQEIDRMLNFVRTTVQTIPIHNEKPQPVDVAAETADVIDITRPGHADGARIRLGADRGVRCRLPREGLRVAVYSMLDHLASVSAVQAIEVGVSHQDGHALIQFDVSAGQPGDAVLDTGMTVPMGWTQPVGLLVAERFARDLGGCLLRAETSSTTQTFTLDLPCPDV